MDAARDIRTGNLQYHYFPLQLSCSVFRGRQTRVNISSGSFAPPLLYPQGRPDAVLIAVPTGSTLCCVITHGSLAASRHRPQCTSDRRKPVRRVLARPPCPGGTSLAPELLQNKPYSERETPVSLWEGGRGVKTIPGSHRRRGESITAWMGSGLLETWQKSFFLDCTLIRQPAWCFYQTQPWAENNLHREC